MVSLLLGNQKDPQLLSTLLLGGTSSREGDVMAMNNHLEFGPVCDATFGYNEVMHQIQLLYLAMLEGHLQCDYYFRLFSVLLIKP